MGNPRTMPRSKTGIVRNGTVLYELAVSSRTVCCIERTGSTVPYVASLSNSQHRTVPYRTAP